MNNDEKNIIFEEQKLAAMKEMMDNIAHQWRQPLSQINSIVSVIDNKLYEKGITDESINEKLAEIEKLTKYMSETIDDFKGYFNSDDMKREFRLVKVIEEALDVVRPTCQEHHISLFFRSPEEILYRGYAKELKQIVIVLLNNAKDVIVTRNIYNAHITVCVEKNDDFICIEVRDNGGGLTKSLMQKIFEPYFTTKHKSQGTGLGLYMSNKIIKERFGGIMDVKNSENGACFTIKLPKKST